MAGKKLIALLIAAAAAAVGPHAASAAIGPHAASAAVGPHAASAAVGPHAASAAMPAQAASSVAPGGWRPACVSHVSLAAADNGRWVCVRKGGRVDVVLRVDPNRYPDPSQWWSPIRSDSRRLVASPGGIMAARGVTLATFSAVGRGRATLSSTRSVCPQSGPGPTCHSMQAWSVTVFVR